MVALLARNVRANPYEDIESLAKVFSREFLVLDHTLNLLGE